jgi:hypothetical protein
MIKRRSTCYLQSDKHACCPASAGGIFSRNLRCGLPGPIWYKPKLHPLVLRGAFSPPGYVFAPLGEVVTTPAKSKTGKSCIFSAFYKHVSCHHALVTLISLASSPSCYPVATVSPPIRRTIAPKSRLVRWLSAKSSL